MNNIYYYVEFLKNQYLLTWPTIRHHPPQENQPLLKWPITPHQPLQKNQPPLMLPTTYCRLRHEPR